ncbi:MAG: ATP-binding protein [Spirochaetales bacterium]|nr:ATP-binding protein [Spirochaetales bacterium]
MPVTTSYVSILELLLPPLHSGLLLGGLLLFGFLAVKYRSRLYAAIALLGLTAFLFVLADTAIAYWGSWLGSLEIGKQCHRLQQIVGAYFLFTLPYLLVHLLSLNKKWKRVNLIIALAGLAVAVGFTVIAFLSPDLYIMMGDKPYSEVFGRVTFLWGREGTLYPIRDLLIGLVVLYSVVCIAIDMIRHKRRDLIFVSLGILAAIGGAAIDMIAVWRGTQYFGLFPDQYFTRFSTGLTLLVVALMAGVVREFVRLSQEVHRAHERIKLSERKNRILAQGTRDCICSLNDELYFINANGQALKQLPLRADNLTRTNFEDVVSTGDGSTPFLMNYVREKLETLKKTKEPVFMKLRLKCFLPTESKRYNVAFEYVETEEGNEIIVTASLPQEEACLKYVQAESGRFVIDNYLLAVEEICNRICSPLPKFTHADTVKEIQVGLREIVLNALEHGNLGITSEEKNQALMEDAYFQFLSRRQNMPEYKDRKITVEYSVSTAKAVYRISDEGKGFDHHSFLKELAEQKENLNLQGRGIFMALNSFDKVSYGDRGNVVTLVKNFN